MGEDAVTEGKNNKIKTLGLKQSKKRLNIKLNETHSGCGVLIKMTLNSRRRVEMHGTLHCQQQMQCIAMSPT